ncbi:MAG TPA: ABC transporter permease [Acidimicrobiales bacterium]|nr:ABC transporter permease [Acidimicrobiales bacterium]
MNGFEQALSSGVDSGTVILFPAIGELISEIAGVVNLGTEGCMLAGALGAYATAASTGSTWLGVGAGCFAGAILSGAHAGLVVWRRADQLATGLVLWFFAVGLTAVLGTAYVNQTVDQLSVIHVPGLSSIPWAGPVLFTHDALVFAGFVLVAVVWWALYRTRLGLVLRATGERPEVVSVSGRRPAFVQTGAVVFGGALAGVGGAQLSVGYVDSWFDNMTNGYGFVAVAVVLFAAWRPLGVLLGSYLFGTALAGASVLQAHGIAVNQYLLDSLPYLITVATLVVMARRGNSQAPEGLTRALARTG